MNHSAAVWESTSINLQRTRSKDGYEPADMNQLSSKNLDCQSKSEESPENDFVKSTKDDKSIMVSSQLDTHPKNNLIQCKEVNNQVDTPSLLLNLQATVPKSTSINLNRTGDKISYKQAL
jgi:hypothetical protein